MRSTFPHAWRYGEKPLRVSRQGFTLIELLVVVSIISVLASFLLPALTKARLASQRTSSLGNTKQLGLAIQLYADDNEDYLPFYNFSNQPIGGADPKHLTWHQKLREYAYITSKDLLWSPARTFNPDATTWYLQPGYGLNINAAPAYADSLNSIVNPNTPIKLGTGPPASEMVLLAETWSGPWDAKDSGCDGIYYLSPTWRTRDNGPGGGSNAATSKLFCFDSTNVQAYIDGHSAAVNASDVGYFANGGGYRAGWWTYASTSVFRYQAPWYYNWWDAP